MTPTKLHGLKPKTVIQMGLFAFCYIPASYIIVLGVFAHTTGSFHFGRSDLFDLATAPFTLIRLLLMDILGVFGSGSFVWWLWAIVAITWTAFYIAARHVFIRLASRATSEDNEIP